MAVGPTPIGRLPVNKTTAQKPAATPTPAKSSTFTYGLGSPTQTKITKPGQTLPNTGKTVVSGSGKKGTGTVISNPYKTTGVNEFGGVGTTTYGPTGGGAAAPVTKTVVSRTPRYDSKGKIIGWDLVYSDGTTGFEPNPAYGQEEEDTKGTTNVQVLKALLLAKGLPADLVDDSVNFLQTLLKDGIDAESAISIYLNNKEFTTKTGTTVKSPFYTKYGFYNDALTEKYDAADLFNTVEGYKNVVTKYGVSTKFSSTDYIQKYLKNKRSVADLDAYANTARLKAVTADPVYVNSLRNLGYINNEQDLTDFYMDPNVGTETMKQNVNTAAFAIEAIRRANRLTPFSAETAKQYGAQLTAQGLSEAQVSALASQGYSAVAETLEPLTKYSGIYEGTTAKPAKSIQEELEQEQFKGLESERRKRLSEQNIMAFRGQSGLTAQSLSAGSTSGII